MSALNHQVIAYQANGFMLVLPANGKTLTKKEAQRLASSVMGDMKLDGPSKGKPETQIVKTVVVESVMEAYLDKRSKAL